jgi:hypothetical protein
MSGRHRSDLRRCTISLPASSCTAISSLPAKGIKTNGRHLLLLTNLELNSVFKQRGEFLPSSSVDIVTGEDACVDTMLWSISGFTG